MKSEIFVGQIGVFISVETGFSLDDISQADIVYRKPSGAVGQWAAAKDGTKIHYTTFSADDLDEWGTWTIQAKLIGPGLSLYGSKDTFLVIDTL